jgi:hypothetical protein
MSDRRTRATDQFAECDECDLFLHSRNAMGVAARHAKATGHQIRSGQTIEVVDNFKGLLHAYRSYH